MQNRRLTWCMLVPATGISLCLMISILLISGGQDGPVLMIENPVIDLGIIDRSQKAPPERVSFVFRNQGNDELKLTSIQAGCSCVEPLLEKELLLPGETARLSVNTSVPITIGSFEYTVLIRSNDPKHPEQKVVVQGYVHCNSYVLPESLAISDLRIGEKRPIELEVTGPVGDESFSIVSVSSQRQRLKLDSIKRTGIMVGSSRPIWMVNLTATHHGQGEWNDTIVIATSNQERPFLEVPVAVTESPPIRLNPPTVVFRHSGASDAVTAKVGITVNSLIPVPISAIQKPDWIDLIIEKDANGLPTGLSLTASALPDLKKPMFSESVLIQFKEDLPSVKIPIIVLPGAM